ncbi:twk-3 [Pristionchus pacificus]|uniref:Twk-3 n=1 Tax=Pristionchus pacificus TaxID=54126 RepID=A0A2A6B3W9_PRIPA|nr:twk-3 [Pristionchus pacificus]|eukprot:PDM60572.1 twk-3 [Pristionchus pacificus]
MSEETEKLSEKKEEEEEEDQRCCSLSKLRTTFIHIALLGTSAAYIFFGALIFVHLERPYEVAERERVLLKMDTLIQDLLTNISSSSISEEEREYLLDEYTSEIFDLIDTPHGSHIFETHFSNSSENKDMWTLSSAVLFTSTTVIPVGYGYITPISPVSRLFVVVYGLIGIPLVLVTMADAGKFMSNFITQFFTTLTIPTMIFLSLLAIYPILGGVFFHLITDMTLMDAIYFSLISIFTIGFGDLAPSVNVVYLVFFIVLGVILVTITIDFVAAELIDHIHYMGRHVGKARELASKMFSLAQSLNMNRGLTVGMTQLHSLARFGLLSKLDENALKAPRVHLAFEPSLDDMDYMDCGASRDIRASRLSLYNI